MPFVDVVTVEKDAEVAKSTDEFVIFNARVSYRTRSAFQGVDAPSGKSGKANKSYTQFVDATFFVKKWKDTDGNWKAPFSEKELVKGAVLYVEGDLGQDVVPQKDNDTQRRYFTKLRVGNARIVGTRPAKTGQETSKAPEAAPTTMGASAERLQPRQPDDPNASFPDEVFY